MYILANPPLNGLSRPPYTSLIPAFTQGKNLLVRRLQGPPNQKKRENKKCFPENSFLPWFLKWPFPGSSWK